MNTNTELAGQPVGSTLPLTSEERLWGKLEEAKVRILVWANRAIRAGSLINRINCIPEFKAFMGSPEGASTKMELLKWSKFECEEINRTGDK